MGPMLAATLAEEYDVENEGSRSVTTVEQPWVPFSGSDIIPDESNQPALRSPRCLWFSHTALLGGAELGILDAARALKDTDIDLHVVVPSGGPLRERLRSLAIPTSVVPYGWWMSDMHAPRWRARNLLRLANAGVWRRALAVVDAVQPDLVISNTATIASGAVVARLRQIPHVWYLREFGAADHHLRFDLGSYLSYRAIDRLSAAVIVVSDHVGQHVARFGLGSKIRQVRYGIQVPDIVVPAARPAAEFLLTQVATVTASKGQHVAVRAVQKLANEGLDVHLRLVGAVDADYGKALRSLAKAVGVTDRVEMTGFVDPYREIAAADAVLMCSRMEAFGRGTIEAMKLGRPVIGSASGATLELVRDGWNGLLFRPGDPSDLADKIWTLYRDPKLADGLARNASEWSNDRFSSENYAADLLGILREVLTRAPPATGR